MEPMITISHYEIPLNLTLKYKGWYSREVIDFFEKYCKTVFDRYAGKVKYWIIVNQINLIVHESFNHLGVAEDVVDDVLSAKYQAVHNEMVSCARATKYAHEKYPEMQIGMMLCGGPSYAATCKPEDVLATLRHNQNSFSRVRKPIGSMLHPQGFAGSSLFLDTLFPSSKLSLEQILV